MAISYREKATTRGVRPHSDCSREITLGMTRSTSSVLDDLSEKMDAPVDELLTQALGLLMLAVEAQENGQQVCFLDEDLNIVTRIVGFGVDSDRSDGTAILENGTDPSES